MDRESRLVSMVNTRGRVMWVHTWEVPVLRQQGCKVIYNPKEEYYPQYDLELAQVNTTAVMGEAEETVPNNVEETNILDVEEV